MLILGFELMIFQSQAQWPNPVNDTVPSRFDDLYSNRDSKLLANVSILSVVIVNICMHATAIFTTQMYVVLVVWKHRK